MRLDVRELPIALHLRGGESKLSPFRDGWRHLRLILVYSPNFLFYPRAAIIVLGSLIDVVVLSQTLFGRHFYVHTLIAGSLLVIVGTQVVGLGLFARAYGVYVMGERDPWLERMQRRFRLEHGLLLGVAVAPRRARRGRRHRRQLGRQASGRLARQRLASSRRRSSSGIQIFFTSFLLSLLGLRRPR